MFLLTTMVRRKAQAKPSLINCAGAVDSITFNVMISKSDGETGWLRIGEIGGQSVEIQGYSINDVQSGFDNLALDTDYPVFMQDIEIVAITNPQENLFAHVAQVTVKNATVGDKRLYIEAYRGAIDFTYAPEYADEPVLSTNLDVGAVYTDPLNTSMSSKFEFCLVPYQISCDGAADHIALRLFESWSITVDGSPPFEFYSMPLGAGVQAAYEFLASYGISISLEEDQNSETFYMLLSNLSNENHRLTLKLNGEGSGEYLPEYAENPAFNVQEVSNESDTPDRVGFIEAAFCLGSKQYVLAIDDKGLVPSDGIYSGTITPPLPGASLSFNIQQYLPSGNNGRVFNVYSNAQGLVVSPDGATWQVDKTNLASWWDSFPDASDFATAATYEFTISKMLGDENLIPGELDYIVN